MPQPLTLPLLSPPHSTSLQAALKAYSSHLALHLFPPNSEFHSLIPVLVSVLSSLYAPTWNEAQPEIGSGFRSLKAWQSKTIDYKIKKALELTNRVEDEEALRNAFAEVYGPMWTVWIDPGCVSLRCIRFYKSVYVVEIWGRLWNDGFYASSSQGVPAGKEGNKNWGISRVWSSALLKAPERLDESASRNAEDDEIEDILEDDFSPVPTSTTHPLHPFLLHPHLMTPTPSGSRSRTPNLHSYTPSPSRAHAIPIVSPLAHLPSTTNPSISLASGGHSNSSSISSSVFGRETVATVTTDSTSRPLSSASNWSGEDGKASTSASGSEWSTAESGVHDSEKEEEKNQDEGEPTPSLGHDSLSNESSPTRPQTPPAPVFSASRALQDVISPNFKFPTTAPSTPQKDRTLKVNGDGDAPVTLTLTTATPLKPTVSSSTITPESCKEGCKETSRELGTGGLMAPPLLSSNGSTNPNISISGISISGNANGFGGKKKARPGHSPSSSTSTPTPLVLSPAPKGLQTDAWNGGTGLSKTPTTPTHGHGHSRNTSLTTNPPSRPHSSASNGVEGEVTEYSGGKVGVLGGGVKLGTPTTPNASSPLNHAGHAHSHSHSHQGVGVGRSAGGHAGHRRTHSRTSGSGHLQYQQQTQGMMMNHW